MRRSTLLTASLALSTMFGLGACGTSTDQARQVDAPTHSVRSTSAGPDTDPAAAATGATAPLWTSAGGPLVVAVGDIACAPGGAVTPTTCRQGATAKQARAYAPQVVLGLGDQQYENGSLSAFRNSYDKAWGSDLKAVTKPVLGNHEYYTSGATGYYDYFRDQQPGAAGYYAFNVGSWRIYALNSNCSKIDCAKENTWLAADMNTHPTKCSALTMHHPLYSSGFEHGDSPDGRRFWVTALQHDADLVLAGHDHDYERFHTMDASGQITQTGMASFVVGTGGKSLYTTRGIRAGSAVYDAHRHGVLALHLGTGVYGWKYETIDGKAIDTGTASCR